MTDRELLELAAKAAGMDIEWSCTYFHNWADGREWNPLTDDGDAFRLAVRLDMNVFQTLDHAYALPSDDDGEYEERVHHSSDKYAATRRAIVRAAAAIGRSIQALGDAEA